MTRPGDLSTLTEDGLRELVRATHQLVQEGQRHVARLQRQEVLARRELKRRARAARESAAP